MTRRQRNPMIVGPLAAALSLAPLGSSFAQEPLPGRPGFAEHLIAAAKASPGCLGIETGRTDSGTRVIFAWFENKKALVEWYKSDFHQRAMRAAFPNQRFDREPLIRLPEDSGPILALVTLRPGDGPPTAAFPLPFKTIGIELYTPLPGGIAVGGRFSPEGVRIPGLRRVDLGTAAGPPR